MHNKKDKRHLELLRALTQARHVLTLCENISLDNIPDIQRQLKAAIKSNDLAVVHSAIQNADSYIATQGELAKNKLLRELKNCLEQNTQTKKQ